MSSTVVNGTLPGSKESAHPVPPKQEREAALQVIRNVSARRALQMSLHTHLARVTERGTLILPVSLDNTGLSAYDESVTLTDLEDVWNEQQPEPSFRLFLVPPAALIEMGGSIPLPADE